MDRFTNKDANILLFYYIIYKHKTVILIKILIKAIIFNSNFIEKIENQNTYKVYKKIVWLNKVTIKKEKNLY